MSDADRERAYLHWPHGELAKAMVQAESDIKELRDQLREVQGERDRYQQESWDSARALAGIMRVLRDNRVRTDAEFLDNWSDETPNLQRLGDRRRRFTRHVKARAPEGMVSDACVCGAAWPVGPSACVTVHAEHVNRVAREQAERSSWSLLGFPGGGR